MLLPLVLAGLMATTAPEAQPLPTGQALTPLAAPHARFEPLTARTGPFPDYVADGAAAIAVSPDGREMLVLTSGYNRYNGPDGKIVPKQSTQYVFRYAIGPEGARWLQTLQVTNSYSGVAWLPNGQGFVVGGGVDDVVHVFQKAEGDFSETGTPIPLGHKVGVGPGVQPQAAGVAVSPDGARLLVANYYNDSVTLVDLKRGAVVAEQDLRPGKIDGKDKGIAGGENPFALVWSDDSHAFVSAPRDRQVVALTATADGLRVTGRIGTKGEPTTLLLDPAAHRLYATQDNADRLAVIDTRAARLLGDARLGLPGSLGKAPIGKGLNPNGLALLPDHRLLITLGGINALAFATVDKEGDDVDVQALVPTGWYPSAVAADPTGGQIFVVNRKSPPGPNPQGCLPRVAVTQSQPNACGAANQYVFQLEKAGLLQFPTPSKRELAKTTLQVADNIGLSGAKARAAADARMAAVRARIKHVVFIVKENRTYDQVLGDLEIGNGDPSLAILGARLTPNHHALARQFVTLDNFYDSGEQSSTGWTWSTAARAPDLLEKTAPVNYAKRGLAYEAEETDRFVATSLSPADRRKANPKIPDDPDVLPGPALLTAPDGDKDDENGQGFLWNAAIRAGLSVRNYGVSDVTVYEPGEPGDVPPLRDPAKTKTRVYTPGDRLLASRSDPYFRGFDQRLPDYWRVLEWQREFAVQEKTGRMPALTLMRLSHDHFGGFKEAIDGVNTVETEMADNDYAVGMLVETLAKSKFRNSTLVFVIEDDAQNGADHVDARRSIAFVVGATVRQHALVSTRYTTVNMLRTIEAVLGLHPLGLNDSLALPMADLFDPKHTAWTYEAKASDVLAATQLPIAKDRFVKPAAQASAAPLHDAAYWAEAMKGQDFHVEDRLDTDAFNKALWRGLGCGPEPTDRSGADLRKGRSALQSQASRGCRTSASR
jgi:DNA-binding beta-propeller fold protein YncE